MKTENVRLNIQIDINLRSELKQQAAKRNVPLKIIITRALMDWLQKQKKYE